MGTACARFGFERIELGPDAGIGGALVITGSGGAGSGGDAAAGTGHGGTGGAEPNGGSSDAGASCRSCTCTVGVPERLADPNYAGNDLWSPKLSRDGLSLYFAVTVPGFAEQIAVSTRSDRFSAFGLGQPLPAPINQSGEGTPYLSRDGLSLYFYSSRPGGSGERDLYVATRADEAEAFGSVTPLSSLNTPDLDYQPWLSPDELTLYFASGPAGGSDLFHATRGSRGADFGPAQRLDELSSPSDEGGITVSADGLQAIFASNRPGGPGARDLYLAVRADPSQPFSAPRLLDELNTPENEIDPAFSPDGSELYFASNRGGDSELYRVSWTCP